MREIPIPCSWLSKRSQLGSTFSEVKPLSLSKPICATRLKSVGPEIRDLLIGPFFLFFFGELVRLGVEKDGVENDGNFEEAPLRLFLAVSTCQMIFCYSHLKRLTSDDLALVDLLVQIGGLAFVREGYADHAVL